MSVYEVYERVLQQRDEAAALQAVGVMLQGRVVDVANVAGVEYRAAPRRAGRRRA